MFARGVAVGLYPPHGAGAGTAILKVGSQFEVRVIAGAVLRVKLDARHNTECRSDGRWSGLHRGWCTPVILPAVWFVPDQAAGWRESPQGRCRSRGVDHDVHGLGAVMTGETGNGYGACRCNLPIKGGGAQ